MPALFRSQTTDCANPVLDLFTSVTGHLRDVAAVSFQIFDKTASPPMQVYPATPGERVAIDVENDCPVGQRLSQGRYCTSPFTVPDTAAIGTYEIRWFVSLSPSLPEQVYVEEFEVLPQLWLGSAGPEESYLRVAEMREEGVAASTVDDATLARRIALASRFIEASTRRVFYPRRRVIDVDASGGPKLLLMEPIIAVERVDVLSYSYGETYFDRVGEDSVLIYNRHLTGMLEPDDRNNPKIELYSDLTYARANHLAWTARFPRGGQAVRITGVFGYTDPDGTPLGKTPDLIKHACKLLVMRELPKIGRTGARFSTQIQHRLTGERTRDQDYTLAPVAAQQAGGLFTRDPEIDGILAYYSRPPQLGAA